MKHINTIVWETWNVFLHDQRFLQRMMQANGAINSYVVKQLTNY